jgi:hypothetical protein
MKPNLVRRFNNSTTALGLSPSNVRSQAMRKPPTSLTLPRFIRWLKAEIKRKAFKTDEVRITPSAFPGDNLATDAYIDIINKRLYTGYVCGTTAIVVCEALSAGKKNPVLNAKGCIVVASTRKKHGTR